MNWLLRAQGFKHVRADSMVLWHHRRSRPRSFFRQMYRFAIGRLQVGKRVPALLNPLHMAAAASVPILLALVAWLLLLGRGLVLAAGLLAGGAAGFVIALPKSKSYRSAALFPLVLAIFLAAWSLGFLREFVFPLRSADGK